MILNGSPCQDILSLTIGPLCAHILSCCQCHATSHTSTEDRSLHMIGWLLIWIGLYWLAAPARPSYHWLMVHSVQLHTAHCKCLILQSHITSIKKWHMHVIVYKWLATSLNWMILTGPRSRPSYHWLMVFSDVQLHTVHSLFPLALSSVKCHIENRQLHLDLSLWSLKPEEEH